TPSTTFRSGAGVYFGPMTKLSYASSGGFSPSFNTLKGGTPLSSYLRTGCAAATPGQARAATRMSPDSLDINHLVLDHVCSGRLTTLILLGPSIPVQAHLGALRFRLRLRLSPE